MFTQMTYVVNFNICIGGVSVNFNCQHVICSRYAIFFKVFYLNCKFDVRMNFTEISQNILQGIKRYNTIEATSENTMIV